MMTTLPRLFLLSISVLLVAFGGPVSAQEDETARRKVPAAIQKKLDKHIEELDSDDETHQIFVRMKDQLFPSTKDFLAFCKKNNKAKRRDLRKKIVADLRKRSDASWEKIEKLVRKLGGTLPSDEDREVEEDEEEEAEEGVDFLKRFWIINGFGCQATFGACLKLAAHPEVAFIYKNQSPFQLPAAHDEPRGEAARRRGGYRDLAANRDEIIEHFTKMWDETREAEKKGFDPKGLEIPWNLKQTGADNVWKQEKITGKGVIVAVMDLGLLASPALVGALWRNTDEKYDEEDTDENGFVDDMFGYDFFFNQGMSVGELSLAVNHGSHCAGIVAGRPFKISEKRTIVTGVAPESRVMVLRGQGQFDGYEYALMNDVDVMSMSFGFVSVETGNWRGLYRMMFEHLNAAGMVIVGAAGNSGPGKKTSRRDRELVATGKQIAMPIDCPAVITVGGVEKDNTVSGASSRGPVYWDKVKFYGDYPKSKPLKKPDLCSYFGGFPCWMYILAGTSKRANYEVVHHFDDAIGLVSGPQGTSYSGPHAAGVAALMLQANPDLPAWRVKELMIKATKDLGPKGWDPDYGHGLLQALPAVKAAKKTR